MVINSDILNNFEMAYEKSQTHSIDEKLALFDLMLELKIKLNPENHDIFEGLEEKIHFIRMLHNTKRTE